jgi:MFS family permease
MNALNNAVLFLFGGLLVIIVDGGILGKFSRRFSDRGLALAGLGMLIVGMILSAVTPKVPVHWYSRASIIEEISLDPTILGEAPFLQDVPVDLPLESAAGWIGFVWFLLALILIMVGSSFLSPTLKSMLLGNVTENAAGTVLSFTRILFNSLLIIVPLVLGYSFWQFGLTVPFLVAGLILLIIFIFAFIWLPSGSQNTNRN